MLWLGSELLYGFGARMHLYAAAGSASICQLVLATSNEARKRSG